MTSHDTTRKMAAVTRADEKQYVERLYNEAKVQYLAIPSDENRRKFEEANKRFFETMNAYEIAARLLNERARNVANALLGREDFI